VGGSLSFLAGLAGARTNDRGMSLFDQIAPIGSLLIAFATVIFTTLMLARQVRQMEHERNALAILQAIDRLASAPMVHVFARLKDVGQRYPTDEAIRERYFGSDDEEALAMVGQFVETIACLARREVLDPSLIVDSVGLMLRTRWATIRDFVYHLRRYNDNPYMFENFEWLARYSVWWKDIPRPPRAINYSDAQFPSALDEEFVKLRPKYGGEARR
jgi:hypothetical protein